MIYCIDENHDEPIMLINDFIGQTDDDSPNGIDGAIFQRELLYLDTLNKKRIQIWINSGGGVVMDGYNICSAILKTKTPVDTYNVGIAASIAGVMFMCGRNRVMMDYSLFMTHCPSGSDDTKMLDKMQESLIKMIQAKSSISIEEATDLMNETSWLNADECKEKGFATEIETTISNNKKRLTTSNPVDLWNRANLITNSILFKKETNMTNVTNKLGLQKDASEDSILQAIENIVDKAKTEKEKMQEKMNALEKELKDSKNAIEEKEKAFNEMKCTYDAMEDEKATNMVLDFAKTGKITNDEKAIAKWTALAKTDFEGTKDLIDGLPINSIAPVIPVSDDKIEQKGSFLQQAMKTITNKNK
jgi:ATP-dependent protease ClpP protease subunit